MGSFCPTCGLPAWGAWVPPAAPPRPSLLYALLNVIWLVTVVAFVAVLAVAAAGTFASIVPVTAGISDIGCGSTVDGGFEPGPGAWTFGTSAPGGASGQWYPTGGSTPRTYYSPECGGLLGAQSGPSGYISLELEGRDGTATRGYWSQSFRAFGSFPYLALVRFDYQVLDVSTVLDHVTLAVYVETGPGAPTGRPAWEATLASLTAWTRASTIDPSTGSPIESIGVSAAVPGPGTYYLKIVATADNRAGLGNGTATVVGIDNLVLRWATNAFLIVYAIWPPTAPFPDPYVTQNHTLFLAWFLGLVVAVVASLSILFYRDGRRTWRSILGTSQHLPAKLRARSGIIALAQTFAAVAFLNLLISIVVNPESPDFLTQLPLWTLLFELLNASVYEEIVFRVLLIGVPLFVGSIALRTYAARARRVPPGRSPARHVLGSFRYLYGGGVNRASPPTLFLVSLVLLIGSSLIFGLAHAPGWGDWKILPAAVGGLVMGYLFLRHGLAAAILFHFATDMLVGTGYLIGFGSPGGIALNLAYLAIALLGAGFFAYYVYYAIRLVQDVTHRGAPSLTTVPQPTPSPSPAAPYGPSVPSTPMVPPGYVPSSRPPIFGGAPVQFRCPRCAWVEAVYENGHLRCVRCGYGI